MSKEMTSQFQQIIDEQKDAAGAADGLLAPGPVPNARRWHTALVLTALAALVLACFFRTLKDGYFLADDFGEFGYIEKIVHGRWDLFFANWTGNYHADSQHGRLSSLAAYEFADLLYHLARIPIRFHGMRLTCCVILATPPCFICCAAN